MLKHEFISCLLVYLTLLSTSLLEPVKLPEELVYAGWERYSFKTDIPEVSEGEDFLYIHGTNTTMLRTMTISLNKTIPKIDLAQISLHFDYIFLSSAKTEEDQKKVNERLAIVVKTATNTYATDKEFMASKTEIGKWQSTKKVNLDIYSTSVLKIELTALPGPDLKDIKFMIAVKKIKVTLEYVKDKPSTENNNGTDTRVTSGNSTNNEGADSSGTNNEGADSSGTNNEGTDSGSSEQEKKSVTYECENREKCDFTIDGADVDDKWARESLPFEPEDKSVAEFYMPKSNQLKLTLNSPRCIELRYWVTPSSLLTVRLKEQQLDLSPTVDTKGTMSWFTATICPRAFIRPVKIGDSFDFTFEVKSTSKDEHHKSHMAIAANAGFQADERYKDEKDFLPNWSRDTQNLQGFWQILPTESSIISFEKNSLVANLKPLNTGRIMYLHSKWIKSRDAPIDDTFNYQLTKLPEELPDNVMNVELFVRSVNGSILKKDKLNASSGVEKETLSGLLATMRLELRIQLLPIDKVEKSTEKVQLVLNNVDLSDGCREGGKKCSDNGICQNQGPNEHRCQCTEDPAANKFYVGDDCSIFNHCSAKRDINYLRKKLSGKEFCQEGEGYCEPRSYNENNGFLCSCKGETYWSNDNKCESLSAETILTPLCGENRTVNVDKAEEGKFECKCANGYKESDGSCLLEDKCDGACTGGLCAVINDKPVCYCANGAKYAENEKIKCPSRVCNSDELAKADCEHKCSVDGDGKATCSCETGYELKDDRKCVAGKTINDSNCESNEYSYGNTCQCKKFYAAVKGGDKDKYKCVHVCALEKEEDKKNVGESIRTLCNSNTCELKDGKVQCKCAKNSELSDEGVCRPKRVCAEDSEEFKKSNDSAALCVPLLTADGLSISYSIVCPTGSTPDEDRKCRPNCGEKENLDCLYQNSVCRALTPTNNCVCKPGSFLNEEKGVCISEHDVSQVNLVLRYTAKQRHEAMRRARRAARSIELSIANAAAIDRYCAKNEPWSKDNCANYYNEKMRSVQKAYDEELERETLKDALEAELRNDLKINAIQIISYENANETDYKLSVAISAKNVMSLKNRCKDKYKELTIPDDYCYIPPQMLVKKDSIEIKPFRPCEVDPERYCQYGTTCFGSTDSAAYSCKCNNREAFFVIANSEDDKYKTYIEVCDELKCGCKQNEICKDVGGNKTCECKPEFIVDSNNKCTNDKVCNEKSCENKGECTVSVDRKPLCKCVGGYSGDRCQNSMPQSYKTSLIAVTTSLSILIVIIIIVAIILINRTKKSANRAHQHPMDDFPSGHARPKAAENAGFQSD